MSLKDRLTRETSWILESEHDREEREVIEEGKGHLKC